MVASAARGGEGGGDGRGRGGGGGEGRGREGGRGGVAGELDVAWREAAGEVEEQGRGDEEGWLVIPLFSFSLSTIIP